MKERDHFIITGKKNAMGSTHFTFLIAFIENFCDLELGSCIYEPRHKKTSLWGF